MADLTTAQQAPILVEDVALPSGSANVTSSDTAVVTAANVATPTGQVVYAVAQAPGAAVITVTLSNGRSGSVAVAVSEAPLTITLGAPEVKP